MNNDRIVCVDDNPTNLMLVEKSLGNNYQVLSVEDPTTAYAHIQEFSPDLILLDVNMPDINGYELCQQIRENPQWDTTPIVFLTCMRELDDRLAGYSVGGDGYITKPFDVRELKSILHTHILRKKSLESKEQDINNLRTINWSMLKNTSEMGELLRFSQGIAKLKNEAAFIDHLFTTLTNLGLTSTILVRITSGEIIARSDGKPFTLIEKELLDMAQSGNRITASGNKYIFRGDNLILLIRNMPVQEDELLGRLKDHLCVLLDAAEASVQLINAEKERKQVQAHKADNILQTINEEFDVVVRAADELHEQAHTSIENLATAMEHAFAVMDLTEEQEAHILKFIESARAEVEHQHELKSVFKHSMSHIMSAVEDLRNQTL